MGTILEGYGNEIRFRSVSRSSIRVTVSEFQARWIGLGAFLALKYINMVSPMCVTLKKIPMYSLSPVQGCSYLVSDQTCVLSLCAVDLGMACLKPGWKPGMGGLSSFGRQVIRDMNRLGEYAPLLRVLGFRVN